jgi:hypothetical protein
MVQVRIPMSGPGRFRCQDGDGSRGEVLCGYSWTFPFDRKRFADFNRKRPPHFVPVHCVLTCRSWQGDTLRQWRCRGQVE